MADRMAQKEYDIKPQWWLGTELVLVLVLVMRNCERAEAVFLLLK